MTKWMTGGVAALAIWFGSALAAEAQGIGVDVQGPTCVVHNQSTVTVTGTVTGASSYNYNITIVVNGTTRVNKNYFGSGGAISKTFTCSTWGMQVGQAFVTTIAVTSPGTASDTLAITVTQGPTTYLPGPQVPSTVPAAVREEQFALVLSDEEASA